MTGIKLNTNNNSSQTTKAATNYYIGSNTQELRGFWRIATKWYFFPLFYTILVLLLTVIPFSIKSRSLSVHMEIFLETLAFMPAGLLVLLEFAGIDIDHLGIDFIRTENLVFILPIFFFVFAIASIISIQYFKNRKGKILKWLIITLLLVMLLSFLGCSIGLTENLDRDFH